MCNVDRTVMSVGGVDIYPLKYHELFYIKMRVTQVLLL
jgi:hypothetical protein